MEKITRFSIGSSLPEPADDSGFLCDAHVYCDFCIGSYDCMNITCSAATSMGDLKDLKDHCRNYVLDC